MDDPSVAKTSSLAVQFGRRIVELRRQRGIVSQEKLGELAGLHRTFVGRVERGETNITLENIQKLAAALGVSLAELFSSFENNTADDRHAQP